MSEHRPGSPPEAIPVTFIGAGSHDLETSSDDPRTLRDLLDRARERLQFYEGFDRVIAENTRRSGELMLETIAIREQARDLQHRSTAEQERFEHELNAERHDVAALIHTLNQELARLRGGIDQLSTTLTSAEHDLLERGRDTTAIGPPPGAQPAPGWAPARDTRHSSPTNAPDEPGRVRPSAAEPASSSTIGNAAPAPTALRRLEPDPGPEPPVQPPPAEPIVLTVIAHGISRAATAISLQRFLADLDSVQEVDAREFSSGILRLQVAASAPVTADAMRGWADGGSMSVLQAGGDILEIELFAGSAPHA